MHSGEPQRRRFPRLEVDGTLQLHDETIGLSVHVRDIGLGGFQSLLPVPVPPGETHRFSATIGRQSIEMTATAVYCRQAVGHQPSFIVGWQLTRDPATTRGIICIIDELTSAASFLKEVPRE